MTAAASLPSSVRDLTLDLTSLAHTVTIAASNLALVGKRGRPAAAPYDARATVEAWETLTGLTGPAAIEAAQAIARHPLPVTAAVIPF